MKTRFPPIHVIRGMRVVLDGDLAALYGVPTKRLNEAVRRNADRFPDDFCFRLTQQEFANLRSQFATSSSDTALALRSQNATLKTAGRGQHRKYLPWAFTDEVRQHEDGVLRPCRAAGGQRPPVRGCGCPPGRNAEQHGALMAGNVLSSPQAIQMSLYVVRAFVRLREEALANAAILKRLAQIDRKLLEHDIVLRDVLEKLLPLLDPVPDPEPAI